MHGLFSNNSSKQKHPDEINTNSMRLLFTNLLNALISLLKTLNEIYNMSFSQAKERPITGVLQLVKIIIYFICSLVFISIIFNKNIGTLFTGLGAAAAILMLVFKDSILGFVASIQIGMNKLVKVGDYIEIPDKKLDGTVTEINLT